MSQKGKIESGAELLARLGPRPSLHGLEVAKVLGFEPSPGNIVELYGGEGVGKTELLLHLVTSALLPSTPADCCHGDKTEVIWVDCDLKFSVLRLAVLLEQHLVNGVNTQTQTQSSKHCDLVNKVAAQTGEHCDMVSKVSDKYSDNCELGREKEVCVLGNNRLVIDEEVRTGKQKDGASEKDNLQSEKSGSGLKRKVEDMENNGEGSCSKEMGTKQDICGRDKHQDSIKPMHPGNKTTADALGGVKVEPCDGYSEEQDIRSEDMEQRVEECLKRVHVVRCTSSQQLICTLHSLRTLIANNRKAAILIIDPISAFFWSDRCCDFSQSSSFLHKNMAQIVSVLQNIASSYGILVVVTKQALVKSRQKEHAGNIASPGKGTVVRAGVDSHAEFLGQVWSGAVTHRLVCSRSVCRQRGVRMTRYTVTSTTGQKHFSIDESGVHLDS